jgi:putative hydrolase of the HAD superfamily
MAISTLFVDLGGVLLANGWDGRARRQAADLFGLEPDDFDERHHLSFGAYEEGRLSLDDYLSQVVFHRPRSFTRQTFRDFMFAQSRPFPEMLALVRDLKARHRLRVAAVSNEGRELTAYRIERFDLRSLCDCFVCSCFVGRRKPDPDVYRLALDLLQAEPQEVAYLEDRELFVEAAGRLGILSIHHVGLQETREALAGLEYAFPRSDEPGRRR